LRKKRASYFAMVELIDWNVGRLMQMLDESGLRKNTIVIFTSDHGEMLGDHGLVLKGCRFYEGAVRVPMIFSWPEKFRCNEIVDDMVQLADISTTLAKLTGIENWNGIGGNLLSYLTGVGEKPGHKYLRSEYYDAVHIFAPEYKEKHIPNFGTMIFDGKFKLSVYHGHEKGELYDIENDPHEHVNLWLDPSYTEKKIELLKEGFDQMVLNSDLGPKIIGRY